MDSIDRRIIAELQRDGRLSNVDLAERVGLTPAPCLRRVKRLEGDGVILGYTARINPQAIGRGFEVLVNVDLARKDRATFEAFEAAIAALEEVVEVRRMFAEALAKHGLEPRMDEVYRAELANLPPKAA